MAFLARRKRRMQKGSPAVSPRRILFLKRVLDKTGSIGHDAQVKGYKSTAHLNFGPASGFGHALGIYGQGQNWDSIPGWIKPQHKYWLQVHASSGSSLRAFQKRCKSNTGGGIY